MAIARPTCGSGSGMRDYIIAASGSGGRKVGGRKCMGGRKLGGAHNGILANYVSMQGKLIA